VTLAKTCHASNMMQDLVEATHVAITREKLSELRCFNCSIIELEKIESHFEN